MAYIGVWYILSKSRPFKFALMNVGPSAGTRYKVARRANMENPTEVYRAGSGGTGSSRGRSTNHPAIGTREPSKTFESGLGESAELLDVPTIPAAILDEC